MAQNFFYLVSLLDFDEHPHTVYRGLDETSLILGTRNDYWV